MLIEIFFIKRVLLCEILKNNCEGIFIKIDKLDLKVYLI